jgi:hypothetical protein
MLFFVAIAVIKFWVFGLVIWWWSNQFGLWRGGGIKASAKSLYPDHHLKSHATTSLPKLASAHHFTTFWGFDF